MNFYWPMFASTSQENVMFGVDVYYLHREYCVVYTILSILLTQQALLLDKCFSKLIIANKTKIIGLCFKKIQFQSFSKFHISL